MTVPSAVIGLTGGIGSGKSTVLALFKRKGAFTLDADAIVHDLLNKDRRVLGRIKKKFGPHVFDKGGKLNRRRLAAVVFAAPRRRKELEKIIHPMVRKRIWADLRKRGRKIAVIDIPLLYESGWQRKLDGVIVVTAATAKRLKRLKSRGIALADARRRISAQMNLQDKVRRADYVINNNGSMDKTKRQVDSIWKLIPNRTNGGK